jgi:hypothetical protein
MATMTGNEAGPSGVDDTGEIHRGDKDGERPARQTSEIAPSRVLRHFGNASG